MGRARPGLDLRVIGCLPRTLSGAFMIVIPSRHPPPAPVRIEIEFVGVNCGGESPSGGGGHVDVFGRLHISTPRRYYFPSRAFAAKRTPAHALPRRRVQVDGAFAAVAALAGRFLMPRLQRERPR